MLLTSTIRSNRLIARKDWLISIRLAQAGFRFDCPMKRRELGGLAKWAQPILAVVFDGVSDAVHSQLQLFVPAEKCYRIQSKLIGVDERMDNARLSNIAALKVLADNIIHGNDKLIDGLYGLLSQ